MVEATIRKRGGGHVVFTHTVIGTEFGSCWRNGLRLVWVGLRLALVGRCVFSVHHQDAIRKV